MWLVLIPAQLLTRVFLRELFLEKYLEYNKQKYLASTISGGEVVQLLGQPRDGLGRQLGGHVPVKWRRCPSLLRVTQYIVPHCEVVLTLLSVHSENEKKWLNMKNIFLFLPSDEVNVVVCIGFLINNHETSEYLPILHLADHDVHVPGQLPDPELLLVDVGGVRPAGHARHGGQVAAVAAHRLHDKHPSLGSLSRLSDSVANLRDLVQSCISSDGEVGSWHIIGDGCW